METANPEIEKRIEDEILVDCYDEYEVKNAWACYLEDSLSFSFKAKVRVKDKQDDATLIAVTVSGFDGKSRFRVMVSEENQDRLFSVRVLDLGAINADSSTLQAINDWKYWKRRMQ